MPACSITNLFHWHKYHSNSFIFSSVLSFIMLCITWLLFTGSCTNNSKDLSDANLNFIKTHPLMNEAVPTFFGSPVLIQTGRSFLYSSSSDQIQRAVLWSRVSPFWWRRLRLRLRPKKPCSATVVIWRLFVTRWSRSRNLYRKCPLTLEVIKKCNQFYLILNFSSSL